MLTFGKSLIFKSLLGVFILNLVCRDEKLREQVLANLRISFQSVCTYKLDEDVNEIVYCRDANELTLKTWTQSFEAAAKLLNGRSKQRKRDETHKLTGTTAIVDDVFEVQEFLENLKL